MSYNGFPNRATWNVNLWIFNEEPLYRAWQEFMSLHDGKPSATNAADFAEDWMPVGTPDWASIEAYKAVDWQHLAESWAESWAEEWEE